jgi:hypothetical protein
LEPVGTEEAGEVQVQGVKILHRRQRKEGEQQGEREKRCAGYRGTSGYIAKSVPMDLAGFENLV